MCSIVLYQDILKVTPEVKLGPHSHGNMKQSVIFGVTEQTRNAASVVLHQECYGADNDVVVAGLVQCGHSPECAASSGVCDKTNTILSTLGSVSS